MIDLKRFVNLLAVLLVCSWVSTSFADESAIASDIEKLKASEQEQKTQIDQQEHSFAEQYRKTAALVEKQGGDPRPLLEAAAQYEKRAAE